MKHARDRLVTLTLASLLTASAASAFRLDCGQPKSTGTKPTTADALTILKTAVGLTTDCAQHRCICDVTGNSLVQVSDALLTLKFAVGQNVQLSCDCSLTRIFFGSNGSGSCNAEVVDVNLSDAGAAIARDQNGDVQCVLNSGLASAGCSLSFSEFARGDLRATISGCTVPAVTNLFSCLFEDVDTSSLQETADAQCACHLPGCDPTPPVCISAESDPASCENCSNGIDDDENGHVDCDDANCSNNPVCATTTTSSTSTSSTIHNTTTTWTTTTTMELPLTCTVTFRVADAATIHALSWKVDYSLVAGHLSGTGGGAECASLVGGADVEFTDHDASAILIAGILSESSFVAPVDLAECRFNTSVSPLPGDFVMTTLGALDPDSADITPLPGIVVKSIECLESLEPAQSVKR